MRGAIDLEDLTFAFTVDVSTFEGFNSRLQRTHFLENYIEAERFPTATFAGKIIAPVGFDETGTAVIRAKGQLSIHGVEQERIIAATLSKNADGLSVQSGFSLLLEEFDITVPKIVHQKVAELIKVQVDMQLKAQ